MKQDRSEIRKEKIMETVTLHNGVKMPVIGFGTFQITDLEQCEQCVRDAIEIGYRSIDTASHYYNEEAVGKAVKGCGVPREELFITSKVMVCDAGYDKTMKAFARTMKKLQLDYLDLYLIHHPYGDCYGSWRAMEELYKAGKIRAIGVSNFESYRFVDLLMNNEIAPMVNQTETHPFFHQKALKKVLAEYNVPLIASEPLAQGTNDLFKNPELQKIAGRHGKSVVQVILRWHRQCGDIVIPKSTHKERMQQNFEIFDFSLSDEEMAVFDRMDLGHGIFGDRRDPERVKMFCHMKSED